MLLSMIAVVILTMTSSYTVNGKTFAIGYVSDVSENDELDGPAIRIAIESFQANGWMQEPEFK